MPMVPPAPGRFSTITGWPRLAASLSVTLRPMTSVTLPGVKGTITRIVRLGKGSCASACVARASNAAATIDGPLLMGASGLGFRSGLRSGISAGRMRKHQLHDLELRDVDGRVHVQEHRRVAEQLLDAEVEHDAVAAVQLDRVLGHLEDFLV